MTKIARSMIFFSGENKVTNISSRHILLRSKSCSTIGIPIYVMPQWHTFPIISLNKQATMFIEEE